MTHVIALDAGQSNQGPLSIQVYSVTVMTHVIALDAGQSNQGTFEHAGLFRDRYDPCYSIGCRTI